MLLEGLEEGLLPAGGRQPGQLAGGQGQEGGQRPKQVEISVIDGQGGAAFQLQGGQDRPLGRGWRQFAGGLRQGQGEGQFLDGHLAEAGQPVRLYELGHIRGQVAVSRQG